MSDQDHLQEIRERTIRIETKLDLYLNDEDSGLPARVAVLEQALFWAKGAAALGAAIGTTLVSVGVYLLDRAGAF